jgi:hypothetical protein
MPVIAAGATCKWPGAEPAEGCRTIMAGANFEPGLVEPWAAPVHDDTGSIESCVGPTAGTEARFWQNLNFKNLDYL